MASRSDLVRKILEALGAWSSGQDLPPEDFSKVNLNLPTRLLAMSKADVYTVPDIENIPDEAVDAIADYLAQRFVKQFGIVGEEAQMIAADAIVAKQELRYLRVMDDTGSVATAVFY